MKYIPLSEFKPEWLASRTLLCELPTEMVLPHSPKPIKRAYYYRAQMYPPEYAFELHENCETEGHHVNYTLQSDMAVGGLECLPLSFQEYRKLVHDWYLWRERKWDQIRLKLELKAKHPTYPECVRNPNP